MTQKGPPKSSKSKMLIFGLCSTSDDLPELVQAKNVNWNTKKMPKSTPKSLHLQPKINAHFWITFNFWWSAERSEQKTSTETQKNEKFPLSHQKIKCSFLDYVQLLMIGQAIWAKNVNRNAIKQKSPPKSSKNKMFIFGLCSTSDDQIECNRAKNINQNTKNNQKGPLNHQKIKFSFLDYFQLLMIGRAIWAKNVNQNAKKWKRPPKSSKNKMLIFGLCSTLDDWRGWLMDSNPVCHPSPAKKMKCSFLDYIQLLMIGRAGLRQKPHVDQNIKKQKGSAKSIEK